VAAKGQTRTFNPPPNWPVPEGFQPYPGWEPDPSWGMPPPGWAMWVATDRQSHPVRNVMLAVTVFLVCAVTSCVALVSHGASEGTRKRSTGVAPAAACAGRSYPGQEPAHDVCADPAGAVGLPGLTVTTAPLVRDPGDRLCTSVTVANGGGVAIEVDLRSWRLEGPDAQRRAFVRDGDLTLGAVDPGQRRSGTLCFDPISGSGPFAVTYQPSGGNLRGVWLSQTG
jgi:hypothetical protein